MENIQFAVSAKTARLIGRENISDVDGAVIELIKNAYDADATCVFVQFNIPFPMVPQYVSFNLATDVLGNEGLEKLLCYYSNDGKRFVKRRDLTDEEEQELNSFLFKYNTIIVMDNGCGMTESILRTAWMNIGTNDKEERKVSAGGRIKTGAKGIGRFALDKLSTSTTVYTKNQDDVLKKWEIDWTQFDTAIMLEEVSATIENCSGSYFELAQDIANEKVKSFDQYEWSTGTIIRLNPTRENWSISYFNKINRNLRSLFPGTNDSKFDIYVDNVFYPSCSFANERFALNESDYDYKVIGSFDGIDKLEIRIVRNEIDTRKIKTLITVDDIQHNVLLRDFWDREKFQKQRYYRSDYAKEVLFLLSTAELTEFEPSIIKSVGPFHTELYFLKNTNSKIDIVKPISAARRKEILSTYSGIKLYRDGFKVRPYGEEGPSFDWIGLNERAIKSPGAVSSHGAWRVRTNQIIGAVRISKEKNPNLVDMANREGLAINDSYRAFVSIIEKIIETFEGDRQYVFKEFAAWKLAKEKELSESNEVIDSVQEESKDKKKNTGNNNHHSDSSNSGFSQEEYKQAILNLKRESDRKERALKTMMLYSAAGVMTNTFSHEISRITTNAGSRMQHLRYTVKRLVGENGYEGNPIFDPFVIIDQTEKIDRLLESWLEVIMSGLEQSTFDVKDNNVFNSIQEILEPWRPLFQQKLININPITVIGEKDKCICKISDVDLHIILNNFLLNSAWFLEQASTVQREVSVTIKEEKSKIIVLLENNGPPLDSMFANNPERIFYPGESSKKSEKGESTGLGLWISKNIVDEASGEIDVLNKEDGFGLQIVLPKTGGIV